ncbi:MAG TPA: hypothetical protein PKA72_15460 [bacterium]|nr:hypothetical protein [bacterium]
MTGIRLILFTSVLFFFYFLARQPDTIEIMRCDASFYGHGRVPVKLRTPVYDSSAATPMRVAQFFRWAQSQDTLVKNINSLPESEAVAGLEDRSLCVEGYALAIRYDHKDGLYQKDNSLYLEMTDSPRWDTPHLIVRIPPGDAYCEARKLVWNIAHWDAASAKENISSGMRLMRRPVRLRVTGFLYINPETKRKYDERGISYQTKGVPNGIRRKKTEPQTQGVWEIQPTYRVELIN